MPKKQLGLATKKGSVGSPETQVFIWP